MKCSNCGTETKLFKQIFANGTKHITERCPVCGTLADKSRPFLPNEAADIDALPVWGIATEQVVAKQPELFDIPKSKPQPIYYRLSKI